MLGYFRQERRSTRCHQGYLFPGRKKSVQFAPFTDCQLAESRTKPIISVPFNLCVNSRYA